MAMGLRLWVCLCRWVCDCGFVLHCSGGFEFGIVYGDGGWCLRLVCGCSAGVVQCLSLEAYYVDVPYLCFPRKVSLYSREVYTRPVEKDIKRKHTYVSTCIDDVQHNPVLERYEKLHKLAISVLEIGAESVENSNVLEKLLIDLKDNFPHLCDKHLLPQRKNSVGVSVDVPRTEVVRSPKVCKA
uniref:Uncharacterized protein n=1 Tax=Fagus sylvatica TaxID=28930 RepID=A0A2N9EWX8_FAGSY